MIDNFEHGTEEFIWNIFWRDHNFYTKHPRLLKLFSIIIHRQKLECTKLELFCFIYVEVIKKLMGSVFLGGHPVIIVD